MKQETLSFLGLLRKGGNIVIGKAAIDAASKASLLLLAIDAGEAMKKALEDKAAHYHKKVLICCSKQQLGQALGYPSISMAAILHPKAAKKVLSLEAPQKGEL